MKTYVELSLVAVLIVLLYQPPTAVIDFAKSGLGKAILIIAIVTISHQFGMNAGLLSAIIGVVLLNHHGTIKEGADGSDPTASDLACVCCKDVQSDTEAYNQCMKRCKAGNPKPCENFAGGSGNTQCKQGDIDCLSGNSNETQEPLTEAHKARALKAAAAAGVQIPGTIPETFSNYTLDNAADYPNLKSTLTMLDTNENIKRSMRAAEYAKTAPAGSTLMTNHLDTVAVINKQSPLLAGM